MSERGDAEDPRHVPPAAAAASPRAEVIRALRAVQRVRVASQGAKARDRCQLCRTPLGEDHRHLIHMDERRLLCVCESCWAIRSADADLRPAGARTQRLPDFDIPDEIWAAFQIPIGLAFFFLAGAERRPVAFYPSPVGAMESTLDLSAWTRLVELHPVLNGLESDAEALLVRRSGTTQVLLVPIDECYRLIGIIKSVWEGLSGGPAVGPAIDRFFAELAAREVHA